MSPPVTPRATRFWRKVPTPLDGCWEWQGWRNHNGYGVLSSGPHGTQHKELAHRVAWETVVGPIPPGMNVCHHCDNPPCVRPSHLFVGSHADNVADKEAKGRGKRVRKLTAEQVREVRASSETIRAAGARLGIAFGIVSKIRRRETYRDVA